MPYTKHTTIYGTCFLNRSIRLFNEEPRLIGQYFKSNCECKVTAVRDVYRSCDIQDHLLVIITLSLWLLHMCFYVPSTRLLELRIQCLIFVSKLACLFMVFVVLLQYNLLLFICWR